MVFAEGESENIIRAALSFYNSGFGEPILIGRESIVKESMKKVNLDGLNDLAGISKGNVAPDIGEYIESNPEIISLIRSIKENKLNVD